MGLAFRLMSDPSISINQDSKEREMGFVELLTRTNAVFRVVGVSFYKDVVAQLNEGDELSLVCEEGNPHDPFAIRVCSPTGETVGYVPAEVARRIREDSTISQMTAVVDKQRLFEDKVVGVDIRLTA